MTDDSDRYTKKTDPGRYKRTCENPDCPHVYNDVPANWNELLDNER